MGQTSSFRMKLLKIVILAIWGVVYAGGTGALHSLLNCHHDHSAETVSHHETKTPHWAGLKSTPSSETSCEVCTNCSTVVLLVEQQTVSLSVPTQGKLAVFEFVDYSSSYENPAQPRAPPAV